MNYSLGELAERFGGEVHGDPDCLVRSVAPLSRAEQGDISFLSNTRFRSDLASTRASVVILESRFLAECPVNALVTANPYALYARIAQLLYPPPPVVPGIHSSACVGEGCDISSGAALAAGVVVGNRVRIGKAVLIGANCVIGDDVVIGDGCRLGANITIGAGTVLGQRVRIQAGAVIGEDGFGFANDGGVWTPIPQLGRVIIGDDVDIGANTTIDRGALGDTVIEDGVKLDNQIQIAHNVRIGAHTAIAGCTGIAGSTVIGKRCAIGGGVGIIGHLEIADDVQVTATSFVARSITEKGSYSSGVPFEPTRDWRRNYMRMKQLDDMARRIADLERRLGERQDNDGDGKGGARHE